jgi:ankyrin repeat protein
METNDTHADAVELSVALFDSINKLEGAAAQLHDAMTKAEAEAEAEHTFIESKHVMTALFRAKCVAHAMCEAALTRVEPLFTSHDDETEITECKKAVASALVFANTVKTALEHASDRCADWYGSLSPPSYASLCDDDALRTAIDAGNVGALAMGVVLVSESRVVFTQRTNLLLYALEGSLPEPEPRMLYVLLHWPAFQSSITAARDDKRTSLMLAAQHGHTQAVIALLACPAVAATADAVDISKHNALQYASFCGHTKVVIALLACPAVVASAGVANADGETALMLASRNGHAEIVTALLAYPSVIASAADANANALPLMTALMLASEGGHSQTVAALMTCPAVAASACKTNKYGSTALMLAATLGTPDTGTPETVIELLKWPTVAASARVCNMYGSTALMLASMHGRAGAVVALLTCPAVVASANLADFGGKTALMLASESCRRHSSNTVTALLACPAVVLSSTCADNKGRTALALAKLNGLVEIVEALHAGGVLL